jgi:signal transduction histidine kinase
VDAPDDGRTYRERVGRARWAADAILAVAVCAVGVAEVWVPFDSLQGSGSATLTTVSVMLCSLPLALRRRYPLAVVAVVMLTWPVVLLVGPVYVLFYGAFVPMGIALFTVARHGRGREPFIGAAIAALTLLTADLTIPELQPPAERVFHWSVYTLIWAAGFGLRRFEQRAQAHLQRAIDTEVAAAEQAMTAVVDERTRIARELHDIVAHSVSMIVVQAGAAAQVAEEDPMYARRTLETIRSTGANALAEMRRTVTMLRDGQVELAPQPGVELGLPALVDAAREGGLDAMLAVEGDPRPLPAGLNLAAYRIVQEALSNVRRHASATRVSVRLRYATDAVCIEVTDDGVGAGELRPGHGLIGMHERTSIYGGHLETETNDGFTVRAQLPTA